MAKVISFVSQKGGVGKTTSALNLATALAFGGYRVLLLDLDPQGSIQVSTGVNKAVGPGTRELFTRPDLSLTELTQETDQENLEFIFSNINNIKIEREIETLAQDPRFLNHRFEGNVTNFDFVVVDAPASTNSLAVNAIYASDLIILPLQCETLAVKSLKRFLVSFNELQKEFTDKNLRLAGILLTMYDRTITIHRKVSKQLYQSLSDSVFSTIIPRNDAIIEASALGKSVITYKLGSIGSTAYIRLADELLDKFRIR